MLREASRRVDPAGAVLQRLCSDRSGSVLSLLVIVPVILGAVALGVETGQAYRTKRQMQGASDAAALAGSVDRLAGKNNATIVATARYEAQRNGFQDGVGGVAVAVNSPPTSGSNISATGAVEVVITKPHSFSLGNVLASSLGLTSSSFNMKARSVAAQGTYTATTQSAEGCLVALTPNAEQGVSFTSFSSFSSDCTIVSNGSSTASGSNASVYMASFSSASIKSVWTRGRFAAQSYSNLSLADPAQQNQTSYVVDPYAGLPTPTAGTCTHNSFDPPGASSITLYPGTYCGGLTVSGFGNVYFTPGIYYVANGDLYLTSTSNISCPTCTGTAGLTFVLTQTTGDNAHIGGVRISSDSNVTLKAPSAGTYEGVLFYQDRRANVGTMTSTSKIFTLSSLSNATLTGAIYFPNNRIDISNLSSSGSGANGCTVWIGRYVKMSSYSSNHIAGCAAAGTTPASIVTTTTTTKAKFFE